MDGQLEIVICIYIHNIEAKLGTILQNMNTFGNVFVSSFTGRILHLQTRNTYGNTCV